MFYKHSRTVFCNKKYLYKIIICLPLLDVTIMIILQVQFLFQTFQNYNLYDLEPYQHQAKLVVTVNGNSDSEKERIGNTDWCVCGGKCRPMETLPKVYVVVIQMKFQMNLNFQFKSSLFLQRTTSKKL